MRLQVHITALTEYPIIWHCHFSFRVSFVKLCPIVSQGTLFSEFSFIQKLKFFLYFVSVIEVVLTVKADLLWWL